MQLVATPSQTVGPFFSIGLDPLRVENLAAAPVSGNRVTIAGRLIDGDGAPVPDALLARRQRRDDFDQLHQRYGIEEVKTAEAIRALRKGRQLGDAQRGRVRH